MLLKHPSLVPTVHFLEKKSSPKFGFELVYTVSTSVYRHLQSSLDPRTSISMNDSTGSIVSRSQKNPSLSPSNSFSDSVFQYTQHTQGLAFSHLSSSSSLTLFFFFFLCTHSMQKDLPFYYPVPILELTCMHLHLFSSRGSKHLQKNNTHTLHICFSHVLLDTKTDRNTNTNHTMSVALEMKSEHKKALAKGLPFPILTIAEYLSQDEEGFCWGRRYRLSGHYASVCLWAAFCSWLLMNIFLCAVPRYGVYSMQATGLLMLMTDAVYSLLLPLKPLTIPFENQVLTFTFGWNFWIVLFAGLLAVTVGAIVLMIDTMFPHKFSTILEIDYDTPYRYFVGNDAHLFGHSCPHATASPTSSHDTESTCCAAAANSDLHHHHHHHHHHLPDDELSSRSSRKARRLSKMKSDASTSTTMSIPINKKNMDLADRSVSSTTDDHAVIMVRVNNNTLIPSTGFNNKAFVHEDHQEVKEVLEQRGGGEMMMIASRCSNNTTTGTEADSEDSDVSTTIIDGKRAISLHNFAKFTAQQQLRRDNSRHEKSVSSSTQR